MLLLSSNYLTQTNIINTRTFSNNIDGICDSNKIYTGLYHTWSGEFRPRCTLSNTNIEKKLNKIKFHSKDSAINYNGNIEVYINCNGEAVKWNMIKGINDKIDNQILTVFKKLKWTPGSIVYTGDVDSKIFIHYAIKNGIFNISY